MPRKFVDADDTTVHCMHTGPTTLPDVAPALDRGHLFVLVHGAGRNAGDWQRQLDGLAAAHSALALDLPGHGRSPQVRGCDSAESYAAVVDAVAERLALRRAVLVGWAFGAAVAAAAVMRAPQRWRGLVLLAAGLDCPPTAADVAAVHDVVRGRRPQQFDTRMFASSTAPDVMRAVWTQQVMTDPRVLYEDLLAASRFDWRSAPRLDVPTLVVGGEEDRIVPPAQVQALAAAIAGARTVIVPEAGHAALAEQPDRVNALLVGFAGGLPS